MAINYLILQAFKLQPHTKLSNYEVYTIAKVETDVKSPDFSLKLYILLQLHTHRLASSCEFTLYTIFIQSPMVKFMAC